MEANGNCEMILHKLFQDMIQHLSHEGNREGIFSVYYVCVSCHVVTTLRVIMDRQGEFIY